MMSLYDASYVCMRGEDTLDKARVFTTNYLKGLTTGPILLEPSLRDQVAHALEVPLYWRTPRIHARWFIDAYAKGESMNPILLELAKLDFNMVQAIHQSELKEMSRWWINLRFGEKLEFARDRLVENYLVGVGFAWEPKYRRAREGLTKFVCLITSIDDVYDVYGSLDELELFTDAVDRWDVKAVDQLPDYMKITFLALFNTVNELAYGILIEKGIDIIPHLKRTWTNVCKGYLVEAKWYHSGYKPKFKEYMEIASRTISIHLMLTYSYFCVSENVIDQVVDWLVSSSNIADRASMIFRIWDDFGTSTNELKRGDVPKAIQCYMHDNGLSEIDAREQLEGVVSEIWKEFNEDCFTNPLFSEEFIKVATDISRFSIFLYQHGDGIAEPGYETKDQIISILVEPISLEQM